MYNKYIVGIVSHAIPSYLFLFTEFLVTRDWLLENTVMQNGLKQAHGLTLEIVLYRAELGSILVGHFQLNMLCDLVMFVCSMDVWWEGQLLPKPADISPGVLHTAGIY